MKKFLLLCVMVLLVSSLAFAQIFRCRGEGKNGTVTLTLQFVDYLNFRYLLHIEGVSIFLDEENISQFRAVFEKFISWEALALSENASLTKTIDSVKFSEFHYNHTFFKEPLSFYFIFTGGPDASAANYDLFIDTTVDFLAPFRLSPDTVKSFLEALSQEHLDEAREAYERQRALEELFN